MADLRCPRCAYDLSWMPGQWTTSCPVEGRCTECGLTFEWPILMNPSLVAPTWFCEHPLRRPRYGVWRTFARVLRPNPFWTSVPIEVPVKLLPLSLGLAGCLLVSYLLVGLMVVQDEVGLPPRLLYLEQALLDPLLPMRAEWFFGRFSRELLAMLLAWISMPLVFMVLPISISRARVSTRQLLRPVTYSGVALPMFVAVFWVAVIFNDAPGQAMPNLWIDMYVVRIWAHWLVLLWLGVFWWRACAYLRLDHPRWIALAMTTIAFLVGLVAISMHLLR
ncbi:MAG: hypothetical protein KDA28_10385 [Phycisphaerales bacterium]|nr:hypothetical protein [Phycisphaerales bacterium]